MRKQNKYYLSLLYTSTLNHPNHLKHLQNIEEHKEKRQEYRVWTPTQRAENGKPAAEHGNASSVMTLQYPEVKVLQYHGLKRQTVNDFKLAYLKKEKK